MQDNCDSERKSHEIPFPLRGVLKDIYLRRFGARVSQLILKGDDEGNLNTVGSVVSEEREQ